MYLIQTVQTSWRPQLPLPKEVRVSDEQLDESNKSVTTTDMERPHQHASSSSAAHKKDNSLNGSQISNASGVSSKKWSFGRLFRKKKDVETESSSEEDRKAGFVPTQKYAQSSGSSKPKSKNKSNRSSKLIGAGFDHIVVNPESRHQHMPQASATQHQPHIDNEFFLPVETIQPHEPYYQNQPHPQQTQYLQHPQQQYSRSSNSLDRRAATRTAAAAHKSRSAQRLPHEQSSGAGGSVAHFSSGEEELISLNSSTFSKYRSDESIHSGGQGQNGGQSRRSRAARNERYYKRLSRDGEVSHGQVPVMYAPQPTQRWKTQPVPLSIYNGPPLPHSKSHVRNHSQHMLPISNQTTAQRLRNTSSLQNVAPYVQWGQVQKQQQQQEQLQQQQQPQYQQQPKNLQNSVNDSKRSISYDSHIHMQNINGRRHSKPLPPPPPPRDPLRRVNVSGHSLQNGSSGDLRPMSYAFDQNGVPALHSNGLNGRCVSDDKIWAGQTPHYQSVHSLNMPVAHQQSHLQQQQHTPQAPQNRRFITRAERDAHPAKKSLPNGLDFHYIADATPRSRKPIHLLESAQCEPESSEPTSSGILRTTKSGLPSPAPKANASDFWKRLDEGSQRRGRNSEREAVQPIAKPRSISSSRVGELRSYPIPMYSEVYKPNRKPQPTVPQTADEVDSVVCGSLHIKPSQENSTNNYVEIRHKDVNKTNSMPNHYQRRSGEIPTTPNKYEEYVAEKREQHHKPVFNPPTPPQRKPSLPNTQDPPIYFPRKKPANLEEAINELEAIYKSLGLTEEPEKKERVPTPSEFEKFALAHADEYEDEDSPTGEPDPVRDDVAYRNIQLANLQHKTAEKQPPFGIPIGPIVPSPQSDYLHVIPNFDLHKVINSPDIVKDDLAVRALRKDPPGPKERFMYPTGSLKKHRATRTQSANIYSLIQRDAAKPSGGDLFSYMELTRSIDRSGSMSDLHKNVDTSDVPATLTLLRNLKEQEQQQIAAKRAHIPFRHPSQGGAICQLPEKLTSPTKDQIQKPPVPLPRKSLTPEPINVNHQMEDALNKIAKDAQESSVKLSQELQELRKEALISASRPIANPEEEKLEKELQEIEAVSEAAKRCGKMLLDTLPDAHEETDTVVSKPRKLHKEGKLIKAIDQVSEAANAVCEKILKDIVTTEPPVVVQEAIKVKNKPQLTPLIMPNLIKKLDPLQSPQIEAIANRCMRQLSELADENPDYDNLANATEFCNTSTNLAHSTPIVDTVISTVAEVQRSTRPVKQQIEEIDMIMQECEAQVRSEGGGDASTLSETVMTTTSAAHKLVSSTDDKTTAPSMTTSSSSSNAAGSANANAAPNSSTTASSFSSSSDCLAKSSSPSGGRRQSSSITSFNPYSSSDYIKSPSSDYHAPSTDPIKTFSTTSYDVTSSNATPNITTTNSTFSYSPSPPLNLTPVSEHAAVVGEAGPSRNSAERARSSSPSQYNSSEELAMIFGIEEKSRRKTSQLNVSGKVGASTTIHASSSSSTNHASYAKPDTAQLTNPNTACALVVEQATNPACLNVIVDDATTTSTTTTTTTNSILPTNASPTSCKLETIPEIFVEQENSSDNLESLKLSPNFNKIYASKISIIVDRTLEDMVGSSLSVNNVSHLTQFDSLSSLEETSSNPDSGNVSLADFPLSSIANNASLQLQTAYNSRFEIRKTYVSEVSIESEETVTEIDELDNNEGDRGFPRLPTAEELLDSLKEDNKLKIIEINGIIDSQKQNPNEVFNHADKTDLKLELTEERTDSDVLDYSSSISEEYSSLCRDLDLETSELNEEAVLNDVSILSLETPVRKRSIVFETPQLNMNLSEVRVNYELNIETVNDNSIESDILNGNVADEEEEPPNILSQITQCTEELDRLNDSLEQMPHRCTHHVEDVANDAGTSVPSSHEELSLLPWQPTPQARRTIPPADDDDDEKPSTSGAVSLFGELRPANGLTTLEHVLVACSLGVISGNDLFTIFLLIIGVITILAIVLF